MCACQYFWMDSYSIISMKRYLLKKLASLHVIKRNPWHVWLIDNWKMFFKKMSTPSNNEYTQYSVCLSILFLVSDGLSSLSILFPWCLFFRSVAEFIDPDWGDKVISGTTTRSWLYPPVRDYEFGRWWWGKGMCVRSKCEGCAQARCQWILKKLVSGFPHVKCAWSACGELWKRGVVRAWLNGCQA